MKIWVYKRGESIADIYKDVTKIDFASSGTLLKIETETGGAFYPVDRIEYVSWEN